MPKPLFAYTAAQMVIATFLAFATYDVFSGQVVMVVVISPFYAICVATWLFQRAPADYRRHLRAATPRPLPRLRQSQGAPLRDGSGIRIGTPSTPTAPTCQRDAP